MFAWLNIAAFRKRGREEGNLRSVAEFRRILECEQMRADRNGQTFSLLVLSGQESSLVQEQVSALAAVMSKRMRATDVAGRLENQMLGALLPDTEADGAWKLAGDIVEMLPEKLCRPSCVVCEYPEPPQRPDRVADEAAESPEEQTAEPAFAELLLTGSPSWKRGMDVIGAMIGLVIASPLMLLAALAVKLTSPGPVLFKQQRSGFHARTFGMYKFRTMHVGAESLLTKLRAQSEQDGPAFKMSDDPRITGVGRFLRRTSIDELPQLWNVLRGDMSLVGPRPLPCSETDGCERWHRRRLNAVSGITCIWQVDGRSTVSFAEWMRMDLCYVRDRSLRKDLGILVRTIPAVLLGKGAK